MWHQAFLVACYILGFNYHSGQASKGYQLVCLAQRRGCQEHSAWSVGRTVESLNNPMIYPKAGTFRNAVAYCLRRMKIHRGSMRHRCRL